MIYRILLTLLFVSCVFDPADSVIGLKIPFFTLTIIWSMMNKKMAYNNQRIVAYFLVFSIILPVLSYMLGILFNSPHYAMETTLFTVLKPYLFLILALSIASDKDNINFAIKSLAWCLFGLSIATIILYLILTFDLINFDLLYAYGFDRMLYSVGERVYGPFVVKRAYFHTSPMLVFSLCYFLYRSIRQKNKLFILAIITSVSLFLSGTRNNIIMAVLPYFFILYYNGSSKIRTTLITITAIVVFYFVTTGVYDAFFDKNESSNEAKLGLIPEYLNNILNIRTFLIGDGVGSLMYTSLRGLTDNNELTYFELFRRYGILGFIIYIHLMFLPVRKLTNSHDFNWMGIAYGSYLVMIFSNPFFFSSNGMVILSVVISVLFTQVITPQGSPCPMKKCDSE